MWTVTRQHQCLDGVLIVELSDGGIDYANADMLVSRYSGEGEEYRDPKEAVETAIRVAVQWQKDDPSGEVFIGRGATSGYSMPFDPEPLNDETFAAYRAWAEAEAEKIPKCDHCGKPIYGNAWHSTEDPDMGSFCGEYCVDKAIVWHAEQELEFDIGELTEEQCRTILTNADYELDETDTLESMQKLIKDDVKAGDIEREALRV